LARPFLPKYFPGYDVYLWLDADSWVQERYAVDWFLKVAGLGALGIVPSQDRSYIYNQSQINWRKSNLFAYFGNEAISLYNFKSYFNAGAFSLPAHSMFWNVWAKYFAEALKRNPKIVCDQAALNFSLWKENIKIHPLPATCNWLCHYALPLYDNQTKKFYTPRFPHNPIGLIHMAAKTKNLEIPFQTDSGLANISLRFKRTSKKDNT
jgi:lipopolysaccharide biosynthesis glycosyltransferase